MTVAVALAGCGSSGSEGSSGPPRQWSESDVVRRAGLHRTADLTYRLAAHPTCGTTTILRSTAQVQTYKDAGDILATNPDKSAAAVIDAASGPCQRPFKQAFARVR